MFNFFNMLADKTYPQWVTVSFPIIRTILVVIMLICSVSLIVTVLMQSNSAGGGMNAISGGQESYYSKNKGETKDGRLKKMTIAAASIIGVVIVLYLISMLIYKGVA